MRLDLTTPSLTELDRVVATLRDWQGDNAPFQLHPGDLGWFARAGVEALAAALRVWSSGGGMVAIGLLDEPDLLRATVAPWVWDDREVARQLAEDLDDPGRGVLPDGAVYVEVPTGALLDEVLADRGWSTDDPWTPLRRDLALPVEESGLTVEVVGPDRGQEWVDLGLVGFGATPTGSEERWRGLAASPAFGDARFLIGSDPAADGEAVAVVAVWGAGPGRPGIIEPMAVHPDHRGRGHGRAVTLAAAAALRELGASSAMVATPSNNVGAVATYAAAGFTPLPERLDRRRGTGG